MTLLQFQQILRHDIAEILLKLALSTNQSINQSTNHRIYYFIRRRMLKGIIYTSVQIIEIVINKGNNKITELRTILQRESQNS